MKLKEILATEYNGSLLERFVSVTSNQKAYLAGFEKARELIAERFAPFTVKIGYEGHLLTDPNSKTFSESESSFSKAILNIGEEEV